MVSNLLLTLDNKDGIYCLYNKPFRSHESERFETRAVSFYLWLYDIRYKTYRRIGYYLLIELCGFDS
jgi:hypothetical protein